MITVTVGSTSALRTRRGATRASASATAGYSDVRPDERGKRDPEADDDHGHRAAFQFREHVFVATDGHTAISFLDNVVAASRAHGHEIGGAFDRAADRTRNEIGPGRGNNDAAPGQLHDPRRLAGLVRGDEQGPAGRKDPVGPAGDNEAGEPSGQAEVVDVGCRQRLGEDLAGLVRKKRHVVDLQALGKRACRGVSSSCSDHDDPEVWQVTEKGSGSNQCFDVLRVTDVP